MATYEIEAILEGNYGFDLKNATIDEDARARLTAFNYSLMEIQTPNSIVYLNTKYLSSLVITREKDEDED